MISALRKVSGNSDLATAIGGVRETCCDNPRLSGVEGWFATHPSIEKRIEALEKFASGLDHVAKNLHETNVQVHIPVTIHAPDAVRPMVRNASVRRLTADYHPVLERAVAQLQSNTRD